MKTHIKYVTLLKRMFSESEWRLLLNDHQFMLALDGSGPTIENVEKLATVGEQRLHVLKPSPERLP